VHYDFRTKVGGNVVDQDSDGLTLSNCVGGTTAAKSDAFDASMRTPGDDAAWSLELYRPTPNPFTGTLQMAYEVEGEQAPVHVRVFDLAGRHVRTLERGTLSTGRYRVTWDGRDDHGMAVRHGVFFLHAQVGDRARVMRVLYLK
jgi:flagellar hook assembly protein FlgD